MPVNVFGVDDFSSGKSGEHYDLTESRIVRIVQNIMRGRPYLSVSSSNAEYDADEKRITRVGEAIADADAANKIYVDDVIFNTTGFLITMTLRSEIIDGYHIIDPYDRTEYEFPFDCTIKITKCDFGPDAVGVELDDKNVTDKIFSHHQCEVKKSGKLKFKKLSNLKSSTAFVELFIKRKNKSRNKKAKRSNAEERL